MKQSKCSKCLAAALSASLALTCAVFLIGSSSRASVSSRRSPSIYTGHSIVEGFNYGLNVTVTMSGSTIESITAEHAENYSSPHDYFWDMAVNGTDYEPSPLKQIVDTQSTENIDVVSRATYTSNALIEAVKVALASVTEPTEEPTPDPTDEPTPEPAISGDVNGDGNITIADAILAMRATMGLQELSEVQLACADVSGDRMLTTADSLLILRMATCG